MTAILRLQLDDKDPVRVNSAINQLAEYSDRNTRSKLTANTTLYVSTSGSNSNSGSQTSPFLTIQHAYDVITSALDLGGQNIIIQCASGTYTTGLSISQPWTGGGSVVLDLGGGTISTSGDCITVFCSLPSLFFVQSGTLTSSGNSCINHLGSGSVVIGTGMTFGAVGFAHMLVQGSGSEIRCFNPYTITGGAQMHYLAILAGNSIQGGSAAVTITGTPAISYFAYGTRLAAVHIAGMTYSGGTTGQRYNADTNAIVYTAGAGANYFPGTIAGSPAPGVIGPSGGIYV